MNQEQPRTSHRFRYLDLDIPHRCTVRDVQRIQLRADIQLHNHFDLCPRNSRYTEKLLDSWSSVCSTSALFAL